MNTATRCCEMGFYSVSDDEATPVLCMIHWAEKHPQFITSPFAALGIYQAYLASFDPDTFSHTTELEG